MWLAKQDATVILACRNLERAKAARAALREQVPNARLEIIQLDLANLKSVERFVKEFTSKYGRLDMLINNAGLMNAGYYPSKYGGVEEVWIVNHVAPAYLTFLLLPILRTRKDSRIVFLGSGGMWMPWSLSRMSPFHQEFCSKNQGRSLGPSYRYCDTKLANYRFSTILADKLLGSDIFVNCVYPGLVSTSFAQHAFADAKRRLSVFGLGFLADVADHAWHQLPRFGLAWDPDTAALTTVHCAAATSIVENKVSGKYYCPIGREISPLQDIGRSESNEKALWDWTLAFLRTYADFDEASLKLKGM